MDTETKGIGAKPIMTFGQPKTENLIDWASSQGVVTDLIRILDVSVLADRPDAVGNLVDFLADEFTSKLYADWSRTSQYAQPLSRLSESFSRNPAICTQFKPLGLEKPAKHYFPKQLDQRYLAALLVARRPYKSFYATEKVIQAFDLLRAWVLYRALRVFSEYGYRHEAHLATLCTKLRIASDLDDMDILKSIGDLYLEGQACQRPDRVERMLAQFSREALRRESSDSIKAFFRAVVGIIEDDPKPLEIQSGKLPPLQLPPSSPQPEPIDIQSLISISNDPIEVEGGSIPGITSGNSAFATRKSKASFTFEHLNNRARLVLSAESVHFLPWSWSSPLPHERIRLQILSCDLCGRNVDAEKLLGVLVEVAMRTGRSMRLALEIGFKDNEDGEWSVDLVKGMLRRKSPRRRSHWKPDDDSRQWVRPETLCQEIRLSVASLASLKALSGRFPESECIGKLWQCVSTESPEQAFNSAVKGPCPRVTPGMLGVALPAELQRMGRDATFTRLAVSHPRSELPGACAYATFSSNTLASRVTQSFSAWADPAAGLSDDDSAAGSLLAVMEYMLPDAFIHAADRIRDLRGKFAADYGIEQIAAFHNSFVTYVVSLLLAATGARPVIDPFESPTDFDWCSCRVFVEDKAQGDEPFGRLVLVPAKLVEYLQSSYSNHLKELSRIVTGCAPGLAHEILTLSRREPSDCVPFFFALEVQGESLSWASVSEAQMRSTQLFEWPLPWNFLRHRLATGLREHGLDVEIIDGLLGHAEFGAETYGDHSFRTWQIDMGKAMPVLTTLFEKLAAPWVPGLDEEFAVLPTIQVPELELKKDVAFGRDGRRHRRLAWHARMKRLARDRVRLLLGERKISDLAQESLDEIGDNLLFGGQELEASSRDSTDEALEQNRFVMRQTPTPLGWISYHHFLDVLDRYGRLSEKPVSPKTFYTRKQVVSPFDETAPLCQVVLDDVRRTLDRAVGRRVPVSYSLCSIYGGLRLMAESRVCDPVVLSDVLATENYRIVRVAGRNYLDYADGLAAEDPDAAVKRFAISSRTATLLHHAQSRETSVNLEKKPLPSELAAVSKLVADATGAVIETVGHLVSAFNRLVDQANIIELPGILSGLLAGRVISWAPSLRVQTRLLTGSAHRFKAYLHEDNDESGCPELRISKGGHGTEQTLKTDRLLFKNIRRQLRDFRSGANTQEKTGNSEAAEEGITSRRSLADTIKKLIKEAAGEVSPVVGMFSTWIVTHVQKKYNKRYVAISTIERYITALAAALVEIGTGIDLRTMDEGEVTAFYENLLAFRSHQRPAYRYERLRSFHRWCVRNHGISDACWSDLPYEAGAFPASFTLIPERGYLQALEALMSSARPGIGEDLAAPMVLLLCYRYGLRPPEAIGLRRDEVIDLGERSLVVVQTNNLRRTKTGTGSQRVVPLVFDLTDSEKLLWERWHRHLATSAKADKAEPFISDAAGRLIDDDPLFATINRMLKAVTCNPEAILYHARHTAATAVAVALGDLQIPGAAGLPGVRDEQARRSIQEILLGYPGVSRRSNWAIARYLGHTNIERSQKSYLHLLWDWTNELLQPNLDCKQLPEGIQDTADFPVELPVLPQTNVEQPSGQPVTLALRYLKLRGEGHSGIEVSKMLGLDEEIASAWTNAVHQVDSRLHIQGEPRDPSITDSARFTTHLTQNAWARLLRQAADTSKQANFTLDAAAEPWPVTVRLIEMVGVSRQLIAWHEEQFTMLRAICEYWEIKTAQLRYIPTRKALLDHVFDGWVQSHGFDLASPMNVGKKPFQIDKVVSKKVSLEGKGPSEYRCALIIRESDSCTIRNSYEFLVSALALSLASDAPKTSGQAQEDYSAQIKRMQERITALEAASQGSLN